MSSAPRPAKWNTDSRSWAGQDTVLGQRVSASPSGRTSGVLHSGHSVGITNSVSDPSRNATTGPTTSGMTSPARRTTTVSPMRTSLRLTSSSLCNVAVLTVTPPTWTGSSEANGVTRPVRPTLTKMLLSLVLTSSGGYFHATAQRGDFAVEPSRPCNDTASTLMTTP